MDPKLDNPFRPPIAGASGSDGSDGSDGSRHGREQRREGKLLWACQLGPAADSQLQFLVRFRHLLPRRRRPRAQMQIMTSPPSCRAVWAVRSTRLRDVEAFLVRDARTSSLLAPSNLYYYTAQTPAVGSAGMRSPSANLQSGGRLNVESLGKFQLSPWLRSRVNAAIRAVDHAKPGALCPPIWRQTASAPAAVPGKPSPPVAPAQAASLFRPGDRRFL